jgi:hypothetical protein
MTAQISDSIIFEGQDHAIAGKKGTGLFDPKLHNMSPVGRCSCCWRGFVCTYTVEEQQLILSRLAIYLDTENPALD